MAKSNDPILNKLFQDTNTYKEEAISLNKKEFIKVVESRRSVRIYDQTKVKESDMMQCLELALLSPNSSNLQPWEFYWVRDKNKKEDLITACFSQNAAKTAQELIVAVSRIDTWRRNRDLILKDYKKKKD